MNHEKVRIRHYEKLMTRHMLNNEDRRKTIKQLYLKTADINSFEDCCRLRYGSSCIQFSFLLLSEPFLNFFFFASISFDWFRVSLKNCCYRMLPVSILYPIPSIRTPNSQPPSLSSTFFFISFTENFTSIFPWYHSLAFHFLIPSHSCVFTPSLILFSHIRSFLVYMHTTVHWDKLFILRDKTLHIFSSAATLVAMLATTLATTLAGYACLHFNESCM